MTREKSIAADDQPVGHYKIQAKKRELKENKGKKNSPYEFIIRNNTTTIYFKVELIHYLKNKTIHPALNNQ